MQHIFSYKLNVCSNINYKTNEYKSKYIYNSKDDLSQKILLMERYDIEIEESFLYMGTKFGHSFLAFWATNFQSESWMIYF